MRERARKRLERMSRKMAQHDIDLISQFLLLIKVGAHPGEGHGCHLFMGQMSRPSYWAAY